MNHDTFPGLEIVEQDSGTLRATVLAPAKLNLLLAVGDRRLDGYHELVTVMQTLDLADRIDVDVDRWESDEIDVLVEAPGVPGGDTLVTRGVEELLRAAGLGARVWITVEKEIPVGGGLGGGSSDAACALHAVNVLLGSPLGPAELTRIASGLGSDVPFFLLGPGSTAVASGRGERIERVDDIAPRPWLLAFPNAHQSTAAVYAEFDPTAAAELPADPHEARTAATIAPLRNDLTAAARSVGPEVDRLLTAFADAGGEPLLCGSGATVAVPLESMEARAAFEAVARTAVAGCWLRVAWTTVSGRR
jgi:4-diphosphocytidyl-2-C-methyl-D-erythritol kinase